MNKKVGKAVAATLAVGAALAASGCSTMQNYSLNGVPMDRLYASSDQMKTDASPDNSNQSYCTRNPWTCVVGGVAVVGGVTWAIVASHKHASSTTVPGGNPGGF